jgi:hypothetical protein
MRALLIFSDPVIQQIVEKIKAAFNTLWDRSNSKFNAKHETVVCRSRKQLMGVPDCVVGRPVILWRVHGRSLRKDLPAVKQVLERR